MILNLGFALERQTEKLRFNLSGGFVDNLLGNKGAYSIPCQVGSQTRQGREEILKVKGYQA